jgi:hypothetical protein
MAFRTWARLLPATLGVGALAGAGQLGVAYGLGIVRLTRVLDVTTRDLWTAQLAWAAWVAMSAAVAGALAGARLLPVGRSAGAGARPAQPAAPGAGTIIVLAVAAGLGAAVVAPLTMQPARTAQVDGVNAVIVIGICAGLGAVVGVFAACAALAQPVARWSLVTVGLVVWALAFLSVVPSLAPSDPLPAVRLGVFDAGFLGPGTARRTALFTMPAMAVLAGAALGWRARRQERATLTIALAGLPGPALLTLAYLIAGPGAGADRYQLAPYWAAMTATGAGVLGSVLAAVVRRGAENDPDGAGPTVDRPPLPRRPSQPESAIAQAATTPTRFTPSGQSASAVNPPPPAGRGSVPGQGALRPSDTAVFDAPAGAVRSAPSGRGAPSSPAAPRRTGATDTFTVRAVPGHRGPGAVTDEPAPDAVRPAGVAIGEYDDPEPLPFDGFARGKADQARTAHGPGHHAAPERAATPATIAGYVPEPATRPLPPEVLAPTEPQPGGRGGAFGRGLRSLGRGRPGARTGDTEAAGAGRPASAGRPANAGKQTGTGTADGSVVRPGRGPLVPEPRAVSAPLPNPTPITSPLPQPKPVVPPRQPQAVPQHRPSGPPQAATEDRRGAPATGRPAGPSAGRHTEPPATPPGEQPQDAGRPGGGKRSRFGLRRRKDGNDYVDWVSGLGGD